MFMSAELRVDCSLTVPVCEGVIVGIAQEICSGLNRIGAQQTFGVHDPTVEQLVRQYVHSGGLQRCLARMGVQRARVVG